jgi:hypothetical protein
MCSKTPQNKSQKLSLALLFEHHQKKVMTGNTTKEDISLLLYYRVTLPHVVMLQHGMQFSFYQSISQKVKILFFCADKISK